MTQVNLPDAAALPALLMDREELRDFLADRSALLYLCPDPDPELHDELKLLGQIVPSVVVALLMRCQVVVFGVRPAECVGSDVVGMPGAADLTSTDVAALTRLPQDNAPLLWSECATRSLVGAFHLATLLAKSNELRAKRFCLACT